MSCERHLCYVIQSPKMTYGKTTFYSNSLCTAKQHGVYKKNGSDSTVIRFQGHLRTSFGQQNRTKLIVLQNHTFTLLYLIKTLKCTTCKVTNESVLHEVTGVLFYKYVYCKSKKILKYGLYIYILRIYLFIYSFIWVQLCKGL